MRMGLTYDLQRDPQDERQKEFDSPRTIETLDNALEELRHQVVRLGNAYDLLAAPDRLAGLDLVFNIAEGLHGRCREAWVPTLLEFFHIPYVGSDPLALSIGLDKAMTKRLAVASGVPTPRWITVDHPRTIPTVIPLAFPVMVKPRHQGSGIGIDAGAVVCDRLALVHRIEWLFERVQEPILIEEFIPSGELTVCVIGNEPPVAYPAIQRPIDPVSRLSCHVVSPDPNVEWEAPLELDEELDLEARRVALVMFEALGCRDLARIDLRVDEQGRPWFLEINPLPSFDPEGSLGLLAEHLGLTYTRLTGQILAAAQLRINRSRQKAVAASPSRRSYPLVFHQS